MMPQSDKAAHNFAETPPKSQILRQEDLMTKQCSEDSTKKVLEHKAELARQQRTAADFSSAEEHNNRNTLLYSYPHKEDKE